MPIIKGLLTVLAFLIWGLVIGLAFGARWETHQAGSIATVSSLLALVYGSASYRSSRNRPRNKKAGKK